MARALALLALVLCGCSGGGGAGATEPANPGATSGSDATDPEPAARPIPDGAPPEQLVILFEYLAGDIRDAGDDCDAQARAFGRWTGAYAGDYDRLVEQAVASDLPPERIEALNLRLAEHMDSIIDAFDRNCDAHRGARAGFDEFEALILDI
jgi:hypothetical protein